MNQVDKLAARALFARRAGPISANTKVQVLGDTAVLLLHGNPVASYDGNATHISLAGWDTVTTRARLRGVLLVGGFHSTSLVRLKGVTCLDEVPLPFNGWVAL